MTGTDIRAHTTGMGLIAQLDWRLMGPCSTLSAEEYDRIFFPKHGRSIKKAKEFCADCPVSVMCLEFALKNECEGIWAGTNLSERKKMRQFRVVKEIVEPVLATVVPIRKKRKIVKRSNFIVT